jgi:3-deoxy-D-manno-octulosonic-acid transferase
MNKIAFICAREKADAERFQKIGMPADKITTTGNLKFDLVPNLLTPAPQSLTPNSVIWTAGSIRDGEEKMILDCFLELRKTFHSLKLILAPRHLEHMDHCIDQLKDSNLLFFRSSVFSSFGEKWDVLLWDTFGNLLEAYQISSIVFVGGSLVAKGGQNPIEPAWFAKPILFGPYMENFAEPAKVLLEWKGAVQVRTPSDLTSKMQELLANPSAIRTLGENAKKCVDAFCGQATRKTMQVLERYLNAK